VDHAGVGGHEPIGDGESTGDGQSTGDDGTPIAGDRSDVPAPPETVEELPEDDHGLGRSFDEDVEAEVAELLGETEPPASSEAAPEQDSGAADSQH